MTSTSTPPAPAAPTGPPRTTRWQPGERLVRRLLWANLVAQIGIIVTGGAVRLTGSGLGCSTWPQCEPGSFTPQLHQEASIHSLIEFGNRTLTGVLGVIALAVAWSVWRQVGRPTWFRRLALVPLVGVVVQGVVGGVTVLAHLHPAVVGVHMLLSLGLVAASTVLVARDAQARPGAPVRTWQPPERTVELAKLLLVVGGVLLALGVVVTGAGPHGGDDEYAYRYAIDPVLVAKAHAWAVWAFVAVLAVCLWQLVRAHAPTSTARSWWVLLALTLAQGAVGYVQYFTGLPAVVVGVHMLGAGVLASSLTWAYVRLVR